MNQALEMGIKVHDFLLEPSFDRDKPNVILWVDDEENLVNINRTFSRDDLTLRYLYREEVFSTIGVEIY